MNKLVSRLIIFFVGIPLVVFCVWLPYFNHLLFMAVVLTVSIISAMELYNIFSVKNKLFPKPFVVAMTACLPLSSVIHCLWPLFSGGSSMPVTENYTNFVLIGIILIVLFFEIITAKEFESSNVRIASSVFIIFYIGYIFTYILRMTELYSPAGKNLTTEIVITFLCMVFLCDSIAWLFGVTMGKTNRGLIKASPNKSVIGFIGGFVGSIATAILFRFIFPSVFGLTVPWWKTILLGFVTAIAAIIGDLIESIFKRSAGVKDSGHIIVGRGGLLDSVDSILFAAPLFYLMLIYLYKNTIVAL